jgi:predicted DNA-binding antitoxin AbrB/MazE fold protein
MEFSDDIPVVYENGVFRPERPVSFPERARLRITVHEPAPASHRTHAGRSLAEVLNGLRSRGLIRTGGWRPTREELHERG